MGNFIALVTLGCFCVLASYAYGTTMRPEIHIMQHAAKGGVVRLYRTTEAAALADIYGITPEEAGKPVRIFGE